MIVTWCVCLCVDKLAGVQSERVERSSTLQRLWVAPRGTWTWQQGLQRHFICLNNPCDYFALEKYLVYLLMLFSDVTIIESKSKIAILARNRIGSKSRFPCTTEMILSIVAFAHSRCHAVMRYRSHQCSAGARTCLSSAGERWVTAEGGYCQSLKPTTAVLDHVIK